MNVGSKIRKLRKEQNLTLEELSKKTGLSLSYISLIERGLKNPSLKALEKIAEFFGINPAIFFVDEGNVEEKENIEVFLRTNTKLDEEERKMIIQLIESLERKKNVRGTG